MKPGERTVTLTDGSQVSNYDEAYRLECEARWVLSLRDPVARRERLELIEKKRGKPAADRLRAEVVKLWQSG